MLLSACGVELPARSRWVRLGQGMVRAALLSSVYFIFISIITITINVSIFVDKGRAGKVAYRQTQTMIYTPSPVNTTIFRSQGAAGWESQRTHAFELLKAILNYTKNTVGTHAFLQRESFVSRK